MPVAFSYQAPQDRCELANQVESGTRCMLERAPELMVYDAKQKEEKGSASPCRPVPPSAARSDGRRRKDDRFGAGRQATEALTPIAASVARNRDRPQYLRPSPEISQVEGRQPRAEARCHRYLTGHAA
jgi:hypothetical protein